MNKAAIYYHPDGFRTDRKSLMGRHAAGEGFLRGYLTNSPGDEFACVAQTEAHAREFATQVRSVHPKAQVRWLQPWDNAGIAKAGVIALPGPDLSAAAWRRRRNDQRGYSLVGVTHTTATHKAIDLIGDMMIAPVQPWDALICTSTAVKLMVDQIFDERAAYLADRTGANRLTRPQLPVIPLGIDTAALGKARAARGEWREKLGIHPDDLAVLYFGRLSLHGKAHPSPMFAALDIARRALEADGKTPRIHLILGGWFAADGQEKIFRDEAERLAPGLQLHVVDGRTPEARAGLWGAADIFTLLSDNIQETFGLAPIEAMAAGLPVVVSDWNGFRDTVEDGVQGYRIPTSAPGPGFGRDLARAYEDGADTYDGYMASASQFCAVDVRAAGAAFARLLGDANLRRRMSEAGLRRAAEVYDWKVVIAAYRELWTELERMRAGADERAPLRPGGEPNPHRADPMRAFSSYPTTQLASEDVVVLTGRSAGVDAASLLAMPGLAPRAGVLASAPELAVMLGGLEASGAATCRAVIEGIAPERQRLAFRSLLWLLKHDIIRVETRGPVPGEKKD